MSDPDRSTAVHLVAACWLDRVLARPTPHGPVLPELVADWPSTQEVLATVHDPEASVLAPAVPVPDDPGRRLHLARLSRPPAPDGDLVLVEREALVLPAVLSAALERGLAEFDGSRPRPELRPDWFVRGWREEAEQWVDQVLAGAGWRRSGPGRLVTCWSLSALLRLPLLAGVGPEPPTAVYLKASCAMFRAEPRITELLGRLRPGTVPRLLGIDPDRAWMLMLPFPDHDWRPELAPRAAREMARLQLATLGHVEALRQAGAVDRGWEQTVAGITAAVQEGVGMEGLAEVDRATARAMLPWLVEEVEALAGVGLPDTLAHGDLHVGNVAESDGRLVIYDWSDAAITFPALDAALLARSAGPEHEVATCTAFRDEWLLGYPAAVVDEALRRAPLVNRVYQLITAEDITRTREPGDRGEVGGTAARILQELLQRWRDR